MSSLDYNKDGELNIDGFKAALLDRAIEGFKIEEIVEIFSIVQVNNMFHYKDYIFQYNSSIRASYSISRSNTPGLYRNETSGNSSRQNLLN